MNNFGSQTATCTWSGHWRQNTATHSVWRANCRILAGISGTLYKERVIRGLLLPSLDRIFSTSQDGKKVECKISNQLVHGRLPCTLSIRVVVLPTQFVLEVPGSNPLEYEKRMHFLHTDTTFHKCLKEGWMAKSWEKESSCCFLLGRKEGKEDSNGLPFCKPYLEAASCRKSFLLGTYFLPEYEGPIS